MATSTNPLARIESRSQGAVNRLVSQSSIGLFEVSLEMTKGLGEFGIEMRRPCAVVTVQDHVASLAVTESGLVGPRAAQRVVLVDQHHDARRTRDRFALQALRISRAVPALV